MLPLVVSYELVVMSLSSSCSHITQVTLMLPLTIRLNLRLHSSSNGGKLQVWLIQMLCHISGESAKIPMPSSFNLPPKVWRSPEWGDVKVHLLCCCSWLENRSLTRFIFGSLSLQDTFSGKICNTEPPYIKKSGGQTFQWSTSHCSGVLKKSISCVDCFGMSSLVLVSFIEFCLASWNNEVVNIPAIILASFPLSFVCEKSVSW